MVVADWQLVENKPDVETNLVHETLFALANGHFGLRGAHEENFPALAGKSSDGTFVNGFFETSAIHYPENSYGLARQHEFMLNVPNVKPINFSIDGEEFDIFQGKLEHYERSLDFRTGALVRLIRWTSPTGKQIEVTSRRVVSLQRPNVFAIDYQIKSIKCEGKLKLTSAIDGRVHNVEAGFDPRFGTAAHGKTFDLVKTEHNGSYSALKQRTVNSGFFIVSAMENDFRSGDGKNVAGAPAESGEKLTQTFSANIKDGEVIHLTKYGAYFDSRHHQESELFSLAKSGLQEAKTAGFAKLAKEQEDFLTDFWKCADVAIKGDDSLAQGLHFNQFHLLQSVGRDGKTSIAAKGLTGEGYGGHYFWDSEIFALPFYVYSKPEIARKMLEYRHTILPQARARAREMSHDKGALFAWRTIDGEECSAFFPAGTAQYHINADIVYAVKQYYEATGDEEFMTKYGAEIALDTARIWMGLGAYIPKKNNQFCINMVTGPDEYTALVDNNFYTNSMAQMHLNFAADVAEKLKKHHATDYKRIAQIIELEDDEPETWRRAAAAMYLPYDDKLKIHAQDDTFLSKKVWLPADIPADKRPLLLHYHYLVIYRYQICKQADAVMALFLLGNQFNLDDKKRAFEYYEPITTHDSSLSAPVFSIIGAEVGHREKAYDFFSETARCDLDDLHGNTSHGVHIASMAGTWMCVVYGFAGMRVYGGKLQFSPYLPEQWAGYSFRFYFQSRLLSIEIAKENVTYELLEGSAIEFEHHGTKIKLSKAGESQIMPVLAKEAAGSKRSG